MTLCLTRLDSQEKSSTFTLSAMQASFAYSVQQEDDDKWQRSEQGQAFQALLDAKTLEERGNYSLHDRHTRCTCTCACRSGCGVGGGGGGGNSKTQA
jgi:hypothetical protein